MESATRVDWRPWGQAAFDEAAERDCPVLLSLATTWCADCHEMDAETYGEPRIAANVTDRFVPVRVDADRRPRVRERYAMGGFPSTVFLAPDGRLLTGATALGPDGMRQVLDRVESMWRERDAARVPRALDGDLPPAGEVSGEIESLLVGQLDRTFDADHGGWGTDAKFPLPRTVEFALPRRRDQALRTLEAVREHLQDPDAGGFFRYAGRPDWRDVHRVKLLDTNAAILRAFASAYLATGDETYRDPADATVSYLLEELWTGTAFGGSQGPVPRPESSTAEVDAGNAHATRPRTDLTAYAGANALAADALLAYHAYTDDERAREYATRTLEFLERDLVGDDGRVVHFDERGETGPADVLEDVARVVGAFGRAAQVLGRGRETARRVADRAIDVLLEDGSFRDGPAEGAGLLDRPLRPLDGNAALADELVDLAVLTGEDRYRAVARETVAAFAGAADRVGPQVAGYGTVAGRLCRDPLVVAVATDPGSDLHRAALRVADHEKVVVPGAGSDGATVALDADVEPGTARVAGVEGVATTPDELVELVGRRG